MYRLKQIHGIYVSIGDEREMSVLLLKVAADYLSLRAVIGK